MWSWQELSPSARRVVAHLTVVIGDFTVDTAEAVASGDDIDELDVVRALDELEDSGLVVRDQTGSSATHRVLEPIRQFVAAMTPEAERIVSARRHARWFRDVAGDVGVGSVGPDFGRWADLVEQRFAQLPPSPPSARGRQ